MTYAEAIKRLKWYFEEDDGGAAEDITKMAYQIAIKALEVAQAKEEQEKIDIKKRERRSCYNCLHYDLNHPVPGEFPRCRREGKQVYDSMYANLCDYFLEKDVERYPISDARIMFDSEKQRDKFKALLEKADKMREILFRGKRTVDDEWIEGYYDGTRVVPVIITHWDDDVIYPETLGQFTGLYDKNDVKVFEGDILKISQRSDALGTYFFPEVPYPCNVVVKWDFCAWMWETITKDKYYISFPDAWCHYSCEVIGNIYDNPELLEEVK